MIITGTSENPESMGLFLVEAARRNRIPTAAVLDSPANASYRFRGVTDNPLSFAPDWLIVPDEWTKSTFESIGFSENKIANTFHFECIFILIREFFHLIKQFSRG